MNHVLDDSLRPVAAGEVGELCCGGIGVARGYLNQPELTRARFVPDPFDPRPGARLYRTGDRVRRLPDGNIEFLGRLDRQVKIRGFRVELGEIEAALRKHPAVADAVVLAPADFDGRKRLVAYIVPAASARGELADKLTHHLRDTLPHYMLPANFVTLERLPCTPNGKVDRDALTSVAVR